ncbi:hypothetical protein HGRIS_008742 [Hohenbuehelia grisea]|uniref:Uncharacterized protein n=1 Tax=Hohenbuehelia grisea TaxID=104357 RepID=A0ABR3J9E8_9AGAR
MITAKVLQGQRTVPYHIASPSWSNRFNAGLSVTVDPSTGLSRSSNFLNCSVGPICRVSRASSGPRESRRRLTHLAVSLEADPPITKIASDMRWHRIQPTWWKAHGLAHH